jgi:hypothetical protein
VREFGDNGGGAARLIVDYKLGLFSLNAAFPGIPLCDDPFWHVCLIDCHGGGAGGGEGEGRGRGDQTEALRRVTCTDHVYV